MELLHLTAWHERLINRFKDDLSAGDALMKPLALA